MQVLQSQGERAFLCRQAFPYTETLNTLNTTSQSAAPAQGSNTQRSTETQHLYLTLTENCIINLITNLLKILLNILILQKKI